MSNKSYDWMADRLFTQEDQHLAALAAERRAQTDGPQSAPPAEPDAQHVPVDPAAERQAFTDFLSLIATLDSGDADTEVLALDAAAFAEEAFSPTDSDNPNPKV